MPISKKRKKKGRVVGKGARLKVDPNKESSITIQDLINVVAYQEFKEGSYDPPVSEEVAELYAKVQVKEDTEIAPNVILRADSVMNIPGTIPVNIENSRGEKIGIGTASPIEGDPGHVSIQITDERILDMIRGPIGAFSMDQEENEDER